MRWTLLILVVMVAPSVRLWGVSGCGVQSSRLKLLTSTTSIGTYNNHVTTDNAHYKAYLVEIVKIGVLDTILHAHIGHQPEPVPNNLWIFAESSLEVVHTRKARLELRAAPYEPVYPLLASWSRVTRREEEIGHIFHPINPRREPSRIQIEDISYKGLFFSQGQIVLYVAFLWLCDAALHPGDEGRLRYIIRLRSTSDRHFFTHMNCFDGKDDSGFLHLHRHGFYCSVVEFEGGRSRHGQKVDRSVIWTAR